MKIVELKESMRLALDAAAEVVRKVFPDCDSSVAALAAADLAKPVIRRVLSGDFVIEVDETAAAEPEKVAQPVIHVPDEPIPLTVKGPGETSVKLAIDDSIDVTTNAENTWWADGSLFFIVTEAGVYTIEVTAKNGNKETTEMVRIDVAIEAPITPEDAAAAQAILENDGDGVGSAETTDQTAVTAKVDEAPPEEAVKAAVAPAITKPDGPIETTIPVAGIVTVALPIQGEIIDVSVEGAFGGAWADDKLTFKVSEAGTVTLTVCATNSVGSDSCEVVVNVKIVGPADAVAAEPVKVDETDTAVPPEGEKKAEG
ncbi:MAG: hypothetical protein PHY34_00625 [Patescibacteria group bacterium]|nr:hypothetical protein [Patescibacteria group bacterium]MDD5715866.1 hypothetical protein [Patescibacteria group bacterium]